MICDIERSKSGKMNLKQFKYVLVLANTGSFGKAADELNISQPSLSQYIKKIEQQVGVELFDRTGTGVRLTDAGRVYVDAGKKILDLEHQMQTEFLDLMEHKSGSVIVGTSPYRSAGMMPVAIKRFREQYPGVHVVVEEMTTSELLEDAERGEFDLCLTVSPVDDKIFCSEKIAEEELVLAVPKGYCSFETENMADRKYPAIDAGQIDGQAFVMITENQVMQKALVGLIDEYGLKLRKAAVVKSLEAQIAMVRAGVGLALVPTGIERFCSSEEVDFYSLKQDLPRREVVAMWRKDKKLNQVTRALVDVMKEKE